MTREELILRLARLHGIGEGYHDYRGQWERFGADRLAAILRTMGVAVDDVAALRASLADAEARRAGRLAPAVVAASGARVAIDLDVTAAQFGGVLRWSLDREDHDRLEGTLSSADCPELWRGEIGGRWITRRRFELPIDLPTGHHALTLAIGAAEPQRVALIVAPPTCHEPPALAGGARLWGVAIQLYALRSGENWGIGDYGDLAALIAGLAPRGAAFVGVNPLHALASADPAQASPYGASDRRFLNVLYLAVPRIAEFAASAAAQAWVADLAFQARLAALREAPLVDYPGVAAAKFEVLAILHREFRAQCALGGPRAAGYAAFVASGGAALERHARFEALDRHFRDRTGVASGWMNWPPEYHDPAGDAVGRFAAEHRDEVDFFAYLQWLAAGQLADAQALARSLGMPIGLYGDYAVGASAAGSEVWSSQTLHRLGAEIGAPPDPLALKGQGWGIPPADPLEMQREALAGFVHAIRANLRHYGALRIDHVMSLHRLWWLPAGGSPADGAYVHYPLPALMSALALESERAACLVIGEDLGVVPDEIRDAMGRYGLYHYKVMIFEKDGGRFRAPDGYPRRALATVTTHDLPTIHAYWEARDIALREDLHLYPTDEIRAQVRAEREADREALLAALAAAGVAESAPASIGAPYAPGLATAMHRFLACTGAALVAVQLEDLVGVVEPANVPGTYREYPNWRRKLPLPIEELLERGDVADALSAIDQARR